MKPLKNVDIPANPVISGVLTGGSPPDPHDFESDGGIRWDDPQLGVKWPLERVKRILVSEKDAALPSLAEFLARYGPLAVGEAV